jgi:D-alanyl-D-alanine carboxypeptidase/D-alanyl-D-alanine-endopeptidase (penicillin-binding protein 4)
LAVLAILQPDARIEARLSEALAGTHDVTLITEWADLVGELETGRFAACVVDADHPDRRSASRRISDLRQRFSDITIVVCVESDHPEGYFDLGALGADGVLLGCDGFGDIRANVEHALTATRARRVEDLLRSRIPAPGPAVIAWAVRHAGPETSVERLSVALGLTPSALRDALQEVGLPSPVRLLLWGRLLQAGDRLARDGRHVEDVAFSLGYSTSTAFARAMKVHAGLTPAEVSSSSGARTVLDALIERSDAARAALPDDTRLRRGGGASFGRSARVRLAGLATMLTLTGCATLGVGGPRVDRGAIDRIVEAPPIDQIHMGILAVDAETGRTLYSRNAHRKFVPASNQKILVTATALSLLGPDHRFRTAIRSQGVRHGSVLDGDIELVASGDPSWSGRYWESGTAALRALADSLRASGITYVAGSGVVDVSAWDSTTIGPTWEFEDLRYAYGSTGGAFAIDEGEIRAIVTSGPTVGAPASISWSPAGTRDFVSSAVETVPADSATRVRPHYLPESRRLTLQGTITLGSTDTLRFAARDPVRQAVAVFATAVEEAGVEVEGGWSIRWERPDEAPESSAPCPLAVTRRQTSGGGLEGSADGAVPSVEGDAEPSRCSGATPGSVTLATIQSPPVIELVAGVLEPSQNWMTEQVVRALGARYGHEGSWSEGVGVVEAYLVNEVGVDSLDIVPRDGSGLSAYNLVTPRAVVRILQDMRAGPHAEAYRTAMAEPGEEGSTLERRLPELQGRVFAKTGTISNVNSLSGYLVRDDGREIIFSILTNGSGLPSSRVRAAIDDVVRSLAR